MPEERSTSRLSFWGLVGIAAIGLAVYVFLQYGMALALFELATVVMSIFLLIVSFDFGIKQKSGNDSDGGGNPQNKIKPNPEVKTSNRKKKTKEREPVNV